MRFAPWHLEPEFVNALHRAALVARTARHLRPIQAIYWPLRQIQHALPAPNSASASNISTANAARLATEIGAWGPADEAGHIGRAEEICRGHFRFLNHTERLEPVDWSRVYVSKLWTYSLHYFSFAMDLVWGFRLTGREEFLRRFETLAESWIDQTRSRRGIAWNPYVVSHRSSNWIYSLLLAREHMDHEIARRLERSVHEQLFALERRLEIHIQGNHLQRNLFALALGGLTFDGADARRWQAKWTPALWREFQEQILPDGGHAERSPMYHNQALADLLEIMALKVALVHDVPSAVHERAVSMCRAMGVFTRPDGTLHLLNDSAGGIAPPTPYLTRLAERTIGASWDTPSGTFALPDSGIYGFAAAGERLLIDAAAPSPSHQTAHAHCCLLSFELDLAHRPVVVDSGVCGYEGDPLREYVRSTRAHNTVTVAGNEQSELWGTFRMARRATSRCASQNVGENGYCFRGAYHPYHDRRICHERSITRQPDGWVVTDRVLGAPNRSIESYLHLHPDFEITVDGTHAWAVAGTLRVMIEWFGIDYAGCVRGALNPAQGWYCPEFGRALPACTIEFHRGHNDGGEFGYRIKLV